MAAPEFLEETTAASVEATEPAAESHAANGTPGDRTRSPLLEAIRAPISEERPCGEKATYDDDFQQLKAQINRIESVTGAADYEQIVTLGRKILTEKSKDLNAACYLALGLAHRRGLEGVAEGLGATWLLVDTYWGGLYPALRRMTGRHGALQFLAGRLTDWVEGAGNPGEADRDALARAQEDLGALQAFCIEKMGEHAPALSGLTSALGKLARRLPDPGPAAEAQEATGDEAAGEGEEGEAGKEESGSPAALSDGSAGARTGETPAVAGAAQSTLEAKQAIAQGIAVLREEQEGPSAVPCRLIRVLRWGRLQNVPPSEDGQTRIEPPLEQRRAYLQGLAEKGEHETLAQEAEASFRDSPFHFWLDLQRLLVGALKALGAGPVRDAILAETALLTRRLPGLPRLAFRDGTPFADPLTREWLERVVQPALGGRPDAAGSAAAGAAGAEDGALAKRHREARRQLGAGRLQEALATMRDGPEATQKARFRRRLYVADLCVKGQKPAVAQPLLEDLDEAIDRHALDAWDPALALEGWRALHACYEALARAAPQAQKQTLNQQAREVFEKICRVDPTQAVALGSP